MSTCELATLLKQYEQAMPGRDVMVQMTYDEWDHHEKRLVERTATVPVRDFKCTNHGPVVVAEDVM